MVLFSIVFIFGQTLFSTLLKNSKKNLKSITVIIIMKTSTPPTYYQGKNAVFSATHATDKSQEQIFVHCDTVRVSQTHFKKILLLTCSLRSIPSFSYTA